MNKLLDVDADGIKCSLQEHLDVGTNGAKVTLEPLDLTTNSTESLSLEERLERMLDDFFNLLTECWIPFAKYSISNVSNASLDWLKGGKLTHMNRKAKTSRKQSLRNSGSIKKAPRTALMEDVDTTANDKPGMSDKYIISLGRREQCEFFVGPKERPGVKC